MSCTKVIVSVTLGGIRRDNATKLLMSCLLELLKRFTRERIFHLKNLLATETKKAFLFTVTFSVTDKKKFHTYVIRFDFNEIICFSSLIFFLNIYIYIHICT